MHGRFQPYARAVASMWHRSNAGITRIGRFVVDPAQRFNAYIHLVFGHHRFGWKLLLSFLPGLSHLTLGLGSSEVDRSNLAAGVRVNPA